MCWPRDSGGERPDAWCLACDQKRDNAGGEWTDDVLAEVNVTLLCGSCYDHVKWLNFSTGR
jgi:hypothetical protein